MGNVPTLPEVLFPSTVFEEQNLGKVSLFRLSCNEPIRVDSHLLSSAFRLALSGAVDRALANVSARAGENELVEVAKAHRAAAV